MYHTLIIRRYTNVLCGLVTGQLVSMSNYIEREVTRRAFVVERWNFREKEKMEHEAEAKKKAGVSTWLIPADARQTRC